MPQVFPHEGDCCFCGVWENMLTARAFDINLIRLDKNATQFVRYSTGAIASFIPGEIVEGNVSGSKGIFVRKIIENGKAEPLADGGLFMINSKTAPFQSETVHGHDSGGTVLITQDFIDITSINNLVRSLFLSVEVGPICIATDGTVPTKTSDGGLVHRLGVGQTYNITGTRNIGNFMAINSVHNNLAKMGYSLYY